MTLLTSLRLLARRAKHDTKLPILILVWALAACAPLLVICGCGGGGGSEGGAGGTTQSTGRAVFTVKWPDPIKATAGRLVPQASNSIQVKLSSGRFNRMLLLQRPATPPFVSSAAFNNVPAATLNVSATAYPSANATGVAQAVGQASLSVTADQTATVTLTMDSTIDRLDVAPAAVSLPLRGVSAPLVVTPRNRDGDVVLIAPNSLVFTAPGGSAFSVDRGTGVVTAGTTSGNGQVTITEPESGVSALVSVNVFTPDTSGPSDPSRGSLLIVDKGNARIVSIDDMTGSGWRAFGSYGTGVGQFNNPHGITVDAAGRIYIADTTNHRIVRINDMTGAGWVSFGARGTGQGQFDRPYRVCIGPDAKIYVADTDNDRIVRMDDMSGAGWVSFRTAGNSQEPLRVPRSLWVARDGRIYVGDNGNQRIVRMMT